MMRDNLERTNIVLPKNLKRELKEHAKKTHGSLSQYLRMAAINEMNGKNGNGGLENSNLRPIFEWMEKTDERVEGIENRLEKLERGINFLVEKKGNPAEKIADAVEEVLLEKDEPMSVPDIADLLPYRGREVLKGLEKLEDEFAVKRIEEEDRTPRWKIKGGV